MRKNAPTDRLEDLSVTIPNDRITCYVKNDLVSHPSFSLGIRYGLRPTHNLETGIICCRTLELVFARKNGRHTFTLPIMFKPRLELDPKDVNSLGILQTLKCLELPRRDAQLFGVLQYFTALMRIYLALDDGECELAAGLTLASPSKQGPMQQSYGSALTSLQTTLLLLD